MMRSLRWALILATGLLAGCLNGKTDKTVTESESAKPGTQSEMSGPGAETAEAENTLLLDLKSGQVVIRLRPDLAPEHVKRIKKLTREGFYNGHKFHRVIPGFMAQTGDPTGTGAGGSDYHDLKAEFTNKAKFERGTLGMARSSHPDSANSQFFICFKASPWLNRKYTIVGQVVKGMEFVDKIKKGDPESGEVPGKPDIIVKMQMAADAK